MGMSVPLALGKACTWADLDAWNSAMMGITACSQIEGATPSCTVCGTGADTIVDVKTGRPFVDELVSICDEYGIEKTIEGWEIAWNVYQPQMHEKMAECPPSAAMPAFTGLAFLLSLIATF